METSEPESDEPSSAPSTSLNRRQFGSFAAGLATGAVGALVAKTAMSAPSSDVEPLVIEYHLGGLERAARTVVVKSIETYTPQRYGNAMLFKEYEDVKRTFDQLVSTMPDSDDRIKKFFLGSALSLTDGQILDDIKREQQFSDPTFVADEAFENNARRGFNDVRRCVERHCKEPQNQHVR